MGCVEKAIIVGGGIGGMVAAIALRRQGIEVHVVEAARREDQLGTGINLQNNALRALSEVGLLEDCLAEGFGWDAIFHRVGETGEVVHEVPLPWPKIPGCPGALGIMRTTLAEILARTALAAGVRISYQTKVAELDQDAHGVTVTLTDGSTDRADVLVAADGVFSQIRGLVFGPGLRTTYAGQGVWRFTVPRPRELEGFTLFKSAAGLSLGFLPLSPDLAYYFYNETTPVPPRPTPENAASMFAERLAPFTAPQVDEVRHCLDEGWHVSYRPFDIQFVPGPWHRGRVVLLGDAAHSLTPQLTSGAGMAIEDAVVLAQELAAADHVDAALSAYNARRIPRAQLVYDNSLRICEIEKTPSPDSMAATGVLIESFKFLAQPY